MRYKVTDGVIDYFKTLLDHVIYVYDVEEAFKKFEQMKEMLPTKMGEGKVYPVLCCISRKEFDVDIAGPKMGYVRGRYGFDDKVKNEFRTLGTMNFVARYDVTILGYNNFTVDTVVDELYIKLREPEGTNKYTYNSGAPNPEDPTKELKVESHIILDHDGYGELSEAVDSDESGRIFRTTFSISTEGSIWYYKESKKVLSIPIITEGKDKKD